MEYLGKIHKVLKPVEIKRESLIISNNTVTGITAGVSGSAGGNSTTTSAGGSVYSTPTTIVAPNLGGTLNQCVSAIIVNFGHFISMYYISYSISMPILQLFIYRPPIKRNLYDYNSTTILQHQTPEVRPN